MINQEEDETIGEKLSDKPRIGWEDRWESDW
jgi:hypothetical protein